MEGYIMKYTKRQILQAFKKAQSRSDVCRILNLHINGVGLKQVNKWIKKYNINIQHFITAGEKNRKYPIVNKICPVCQKTFQTSQGSPKEKQTCSYACSNVLFRSGKNNGNYINGNCGELWYRVVCFKYYDRKCAICGWDKSVDVHHIDGDNKNNDPKNLIPLCANHHRLTVMTEYKNEIYQEIKTIVNNKFGDT
jgi:hypothetical protein